MPKRGRKITFRGGGPGGPKRYEFTEKYLQSIADDLQKRNVEKPVTIVDDVQTGLRAICRNTGRVSFHISFVLDEGKGRANERPFRIIGELPEMSVSEARYIGGLIRKLGEKGIDMRKGPRTERLVQELKEWGENWRPDIKGAKELPLTLDLKAARLEDIQKSLASAPDTRYVVKDTVLPGLRAVVRLREPIRFRVGNLTIGKFPDMSVEEARKAAKPLIDALAAGAVVEEAD